MGGVTTHDAWKLVALFEDLFSAACSWRMYILEGIVVVLMKTYSLRITF
jgi:hypothetical protein